MLARGIHLLGPLILSAATFAAQKLDVPTPEPNGIVGIRIGLESDVELAIETFRAWREVRGDGRAHVVCEFRVLPEGARVRETTEVARQRMQQTFVADAEPRRCELSLTPFMGRYRVRMRAGTAERSAFVPASVVEVRGKDLYLNDERFLLKGIAGHPIWGREDWAPRRFKELGANTVRGGVRSSEQIQAAEEAGLMLIVLGSGAGCWWVPRNEHRFEAAKEAALGKMKRKILTLRDSPNLLIWNVANEVVMGRKSPPHMEMATQLLEELHELTRRVDPHHPTAYSNCCHDYRVPDVLDIYAHNSYLAERGADRGVPIDEYARSQGFPSRPYIHTEFGANIYRSDFMIQGGPSHPIAERIHAWNFPNRWRELLDFGAVGGDVFCWGDSPWREGALFVPAGHLRCGITVEDSLPKLAYYEVTKMLRDVTAAKAFGNGTLSLAFESRRDYALRNVRLKLDVDGERSEHRVSDFGSLARHAATVPCPANPRRVAWRLEYTTHHGLRGVSHGVLPVALEEDDFLRQLDSRPEAPFLRELFYTHVATIEGDESITTKAELLRGGVYHALLKKRDGRGAIVALWRNRGLSDKVVSFDVPVRGTPIEIDTMGRPVRAWPNYEATDNGLRLSSVRVHAVERGVRIFRIMPGDPARLPSIVETSLEDARLTPSEGGMAFTGLAVPGEPFRVILEGPPPRRANAGAIPLRMMPFDGGTVLSGRMPGRAVDDVYHPLAAKWRFKADPTHVGEYRGWASADFDDSDWALLRIGASWLSQGYEDLRTFGWYRTKLERPKQFEGRRTLLHFEGVAEKAWVYLNGGLLTTHSGFDEPFDIDITGLVRPGARSVLAVKVFARRYQCAMWELNDLVIRFRRRPKTAGIYKAVWLHSPGARAPIRVKLRYSF